MTPVDRLGAPLCLLQVHAHPDDEASKGSGTTARYAAEGVRNVLVTCTGGEAGDILNPAVDTPENRARLPELRMEELAAAADVLGYAAVHLLGYRDSGMPDTDHNGHDEAFANVPFDEAVERLVRIVRAERPQVVIGYDEDREFYPHPDHIRVHEISVAAFEAAGDPGRFPDAGPAWQPAKLYFAGWSRERIVQLDRAHHDLGLESPYRDWFGSGRADRGEAFTTMIDVGEHLAKRRAALLAHRTQVDPEGFWMRLPDDVIRRYFPWEEFRLARSLVETGVPPGETEEDLFAGVRADAHVGG